MNVNIFKIRPCFLVPFTLIVLLLFCLLVWNLLKEPVGIQIISALLFVVTLAIAVETLERKITLDEQGIKIKKFFREKYLRWSDITHVGMVNFKQKAYFLLTTTKGFHYFSNMYKNHPFIVRHLLDHLEPEKIETEVKHYLEAPKERRSVIVLSWLTVCLLVFFILSKLWAI